MKNYTIKVNFFLPSFVYNVSANSRAAAVQMARDVASYELDLFYEASARRDDVGVSILETTNEE